MSKINKVNLRETVEYKTLEDALVKAANELGWKVVEIKDSFATDFELGSVREVERYTHTEIKLKKILPQMRIRTHGQYAKGPTNCFYVWVGFPFGVASEKKVRQYLEAVSENLAST